ncbi:MAG TPA: hypothetical protein VFB80_16355 [Pirellulaceae bacterium]|nr:hypothetical protein [Pirellulaceae bacterium]
MQSHVLIEVRGGVAEYQTAGPVAVTLIDYDNDPTAEFPHDWDNVDPAATSRPVYYLSQLDPAERNVLRNTLAPGHDDLLAACEAVLESLERNLAADYLPETRAALADAIAKAKGGGQ